jgi:creatinine amidohydrolase
MTWDEVGRQLAAGRSAIVPIGAGAKEHGLHLPMATDFIQAQWFSGVLAREIDAIVWPVLSYGYYPAFTAYAGSVSLSRDTFAATIREICEGLLAFRARAVFMLDTGISTRPVIAEAIATTTQPERVHHLCVGDGPRYRAAVTGLCEQTHGSHADELETSRMLVLSPHSVDMTRAQASPSLEGPVAAGPLTPVDVNSPNYSPSGSFGDPTKATAQKGEVLLAALVEDLLTDARAALAG